MASFNSSKILSLMFLDIITGDVHIHKQSLNIMITMVADRLRSEKLDKDLAPIAKFRTRLHLTVSHILHNTYPLPIENVNREADIKRFLDYFDKFCIKIDEKLADEKGLEQIKLIEDIEALELARNLCYSATGDYSDALSGKPSGYTDASNKYVYALDLVIPIINHYNLVDISESDYANAARAAAKRSESTRLSKEIQI
jgi:hypothetical protein